jgi:hypothetical protein
MKWIILVLALITSSCYIEPSIGAEVEIVSWYQTEDVYITCIVKDTTYTSFRHCDVLFLVKSDDNIERARKITIHKEGKYSDIQVRMDGRIALEVRALTMEVY